MNSSISNAKVIGLPGSNQEPSRRRLRRNASNFIPEVFLQQLSDRKRGKRKDPTYVDNDRQRGVSKANVSCGQLETRSETVSVTSVNDSTLNAFFRRPSNRKRKWEAMTTSTPKDEVVATSNASQEPVRKRSRKYMNESSTRKSNRSRKEVHTPTSNATKSSANNTGASRVQDTIDSRVDSVSTSEIPQLDSPTTKTNDSAASRILIRRANRRRDRQNIVQKRSRQKCVQKMVDSRVNSVSTSEAPSVDASSTKTNDSTSEIFIRRPWTNCKQKNVRNRSTNNTSTSTSSIPQMIPRNRKRRRQETSSKYGLAVNDNQSFVVPLLIGGPQNTTVSMLDVPNYESTEEHIEPQKKTISKKTWIESQTFRNADDAKAFIKIQSIWSIYTSNSVKGGKKVIYRCKNAKLREKQCEASVRLFYPSHKAEVIMHTTANQHTCQQKRNAMTDATKSRIEELFKDGFKTRKAIQCKLAAAKITLPTKHQLNNFISQLNVKLFGASSISLGELEVFLRDHSAIPEDENEAFISDYSCNDANDGDFKFFVTTKTLLRNAVGCEIVSADTTYKMTWQGFPLSPVGTIDKNRKFHLFGTLVSKDEKTDDYRFAFNTVKNAVCKIFQHDMNPKLLISDAAQAIHNGAKSVFGSKIVILMCCFHAKKAVRKNIGRFVKDTRIQGEILSDMSSLNQATTKDVFDKASLLFLQKYSKHADFCIYFKNEWLDKNRIWYEGACLLAGVKLAPSTNNALESWNCNIKDEKSERNRFPFNIFKNKIFEWTVEWSMEYPSGAKTFDKTPTIGLPLWTEAYKWVKKNKPIKRNVEGAGSICYKFAAGEAQVVKDWTLLSKWTTFKDFKERFQLGWKTYIQDADEWMNGSCSCPSYMKQFVCKHIVGLAIRLKFVTPPIEAKALPLDQKRKRGRPSKAKKALLVH